MPPAKYRPFIAYSSAHTLVESGLTKLVAI